MILLRIWIVVSVYFGGFAGLTVSLNITNLLNQYVLVCGFDYVCNSSLVSFVNLSSPVIPTGYQEKSPCPMCRCEDNCFINNDCCPDILFTHPDVTCEDMAIVGERYGVLTVASCPDSFHDTEIKNGCTKNYTSSEVFVNVPVTSKTNRTIYRNKNCAECHGESNIEPWELSIYCARKVDLNHFSSYDEILQATRENLCEVKYKERSINTHYHCASEISRNVKKFGVNQCNMTGNWVTYDADIEWACTNYNNLHHWRAEYKSYKNIFCYMCNTGKPRVSSPLIETCNITRQWYVYDVTLLQACLTYPTSEVSFPFKNMFCYLCNRNTYTSDVFSDVLTRFDETVTWDPENNTFEYSAYFDLLHFFFDSRFNYSHNVSIPTLKVDIDALVFSNKEGGKVDISKLVEYQYLHFGFQNFCKDWVISENYTLRYRQGIQQCRCDLDCFDFRECCSDLALLFPLKKQPLIISSCVIDIEVDPFTKNSCENRNSSSELVYTLPVRSKSSYVTYANMFCYICNEKTFGTAPEVGTPDDFTDLQNIKVKCSTLFDSTWYMTLQDIITDSQRFPCSIHFEEFRHQFTTDYTVSKCNETGLWSVYDPDIEWACENYFETFTQFRIDDDNVYKNLFCKMCNEANDKPDAKYISTCRPGSEQVETEDTLYACEHLPKINTLDVYKNWFCKRCNPSLPKIQNGIQTMDPLILNIPHRPTCPSESQAPIAGTLPPVLRGTYRNMFSVATNTFNNFGDLEMEYESEAQAECKGDQTYDRIKKTCRKNVCFDGSMIRNGKCTPFLEITNNLGYVIALRLDGNMTFDIPANIETFIDIIPKILQAIIQEKLDRTITDVNSIVLTNTSCNVEFVPEIPLEVSVLVHISFIIQQSVNRQTVQDLLLNMINGSMLYNNPYFELNATSSVDYSAFSLPMRIYSLDLRSNCFQAKQKLTYDRHQYRLSLVSELLICKMVTIDADQFSIDHLGLRITLIPTNRTLDIGKFRISSNGTAEICEDEFEQMMEYSSRTDIHDDHLVLILGVVSIVFVCLSLLGLLCTFITYCMSPPLRSIPGKNNMCLIVALFFAQSLIQFGLMQTEYPTLCVVLGISIHYFWLATFFCMNVCSFHMFYTFVFPFSKMQSSRATLRYILYSYGTSALIVIIHIVVSLSATGNVGYGKYKCFVSSIPALVASFIAPVFLICIVNVFFFSFTAYKLKSAPKVKSNKDSKIEFQVYVKLFVLTGITWIFQLMESFLPMSYFSVVVAVLNASQGIFIFFAYSVNSRARALYGNLLFSFRSTSSAIYQKPSSQNQSEDNV